MSEFTLSTGFLLKLYTNKNSNLFRRAADNLIKEKETGGGSATKIGIVYDDFNANPEIAKKWRIEYPEMTVYSVAPRGKTLIMDDKVRFGRTMLEKMKRLQYMPPTLF